MKRAAVLQDISGLGRCSLGAALPVLSVLGVQCCPVPTAVFTNQTGFSRFASLDCGAFLKEFIALWQYHGVALDGIYTGYLSSAEQIAAVRAFLDAFRAPDTLLLIDPVMGDHGQRYPGFDDALCAAVAEFAAQADVITPNVTELCLLAGEDYGAFTSRDAAGQLEMLRHMCEQLPPPMAAITGWRRGGAVCNVTWREGALRVFESPSLPGSFSGTGDLFASALCGGLLRGDSLEGAAARATRFLERAIAQADPARGEEGVPFENHLRELLY